MSRKLEAEIGPFRRDLSVEDVEAAHEAACRIARRELDLDRARRQIAVEDKRDRLELKERGLELKQKRACARTGRRHDLLDLAERAAFDVWAAIGVLAATATMLAGAWTYEAHGCFPSSITSTGGRATTALVLELAVPSRHCT